MLRRIGCPHCGKQLNVPAELVGKKVACPRCSNQFRPAAGDGVEVSSHLVVAPQNPDLYPPGAVPTVQPASSSSDSQIEEPPKSAPQTRLQTARFIERDANATNVKLGADGQLPDLALATQERRVEAGSESDSSHPWVLISVLCISVLLSVLILVIDEPLPGHTSDKAEARQKLEAIFASWDRTDAAAREIRDLLARALQAYNRGDSAQEKEYYRQILNLLNREDAPKYGGYTGNDKMLEETLSELLR